MLKLKYELCTSKCITTDLIFSLVERKVIKNNNESDFPKSHSVGCNEVE